MADDASPETPEQDVQTTKGGKSGLAIASLVLGILSLVLGWIPVVGWLLIVLAILLGIISLYHIRKRNLGGAAMAIAGIVLAVVAILIIALFMGAIAYFNSTSSQRFAANNCAILGGFSCTNYAINGATQQIQFTVTNNLGLTVDSVNVTLDTSDCALQQPTVPVGKLGNTEQHTVTFDCVSGILPKQLQGDITISYELPNETTSKTARGSLESPVQ